MSGLALKNEKEPIPRIVCTKCPAVVRVHHIVKNLHPYTDDVLVWIECHGQRFVGRIPWETNYQGVKIRQKTEFLLSELVVMNPNAFHMEACERQMVMWGERTEDLREAISWSTFELPEFGELMKAVK